jgi:hypothetical protein
MVGQLETVGVGFQSVTESMDTNTSRAQGRPSSQETGMILSEDKRRMAQSLRDDPSQNVAAICKTLGIVRTTFYRYTKGKKVES